MKACPVRLRERPLGSAEVVVIGYGNTLRSDDGFGPAVADLLRERLSDERVRVFTRQLLSVDLVGDLEQAGFCVLVDAATAGTAGELRVSEVAPVPPAAATLGHELSAAALLGLTQQLQGRAPQCVLYSIFPSSMELGEHLSPSVAALVPRAVEAILLRIERYWGEGESGKARH